MTTQHASSPIDGSHILIVEDDPMMAELTAQMLRRVGATTSVARTAMDALDAIEDQNPDLIVLDLNLPDLDGLDLLAVFRSHSETPIVVLTGHLEPEFRVKAVEAGASAFLTKPISAQVLIPAVAHAMTTSHDVIHSELIQQINAERAALPPVESPQAATDASPTSTPTAATSYGRFIDELSPHLEDADMFVRSFIQRGGQ